MSKSSNGSIGKKSSNGSAASSPDITSRGTIVNHSHNNNNNNTNNNNNNSVNGNGQIAAMSETSDDSSLNSVDLDPMGEFSLNYNQLSLFFY